MPESRPGTLRTLVLLMLAGAWMTSALANADPIWIHAEDDPPEWGLGVRVARAGDVDGNGAEDLLVLLDDADDQVEVQLFLGACDGTFGDAAASRIVGTSEGWNNWSQAWQPDGLLLGGADLNGDGFSDVIVLNRNFAEDMDACVEGPSENEPGCTDYCNQGVIRVWFGCDSDSCETGLKEETLDIENDPDWVWKSEPGQFQIGELNTFATGDINDDGYDDLLVGEHQWDHTAGHHCQWPGEGDSGTNRGRVLIFAGGPGFGDLTRTVEAPLGAWRRAPVQIAVLGDVDGHHGTDFAISDDLVHEADPFLRGLVYIYDGTSDTAPKYTLRGDMEDSLHGDELAGPGNVDDDPLADVAVGTYWEEGVDRERWLTCYRGASFGPVESFSTEDSHVWWNLSATSGVPSDGHGGLVANYVPGILGYMHRAGSEGGLQETASFPEPPSECTGAYWIWTASLGDVNDDGNEDFVHGYPSWYDGYTMPDCIPRIEVVSGEPGGDCNETRCMDEIDNDGDTFVDCLDSDCRGRTGCPRHESICDDYIDNDGDTLADCDDLDCLGLDGCKDKEFACANGIDDDGDRLVDCLDVDCAEAPDCDITNETDCDDTFDNDGDTLTDCLDWDCTLAGLGGCVVPEEQPPAQNGMDDCGAEQGQLFYSKAAGVADDGLGISEYCDTPVDQRHDVAPSGRMANMAILAHNGQESLAVTDLFIRGPDRATSLKVTRRQLTRAYDEHSPFGPAWHLPYRQILTQDGVTGDLVLEASGRRDVYAKVPSDSVWRGTNGRYETITLDGSDSLLLRTRGGTVATFTTEGSAGSFVGLLEKITSAKGNELTLNYETSVEEPDLLARHLLSITDAYGRETEFLYEDTEHPDFVSSIVDPDDRAVAYSYDDLGNLTSVEAPEVATRADELDPVRHPKTLYSYRGLTDNEDVDATGVLTHALTSAVFPNQETVGRARLSWTIDETLGGSQPFGWVLHHAIGDASSPPDDAEGGLYSYAYSIGDLGTSINTPLVAASITDRSGTSATLQMNRIGQMLNETVHPRGIRPPGSGGSADMERLFEYNDDGDLIGTTSVLLSTSTHAHDTSGHRIVQGNETLVTVAKDAVRDAAQEEITRRVVYEPVFNKPFKVVEARGFEPGPESDYSTIYIYDYMEDLADNKTYFAALLGMDASELQGLFNDADIDDVAELNGDGSHRAGNVIRIIHPDVSEPAEQSAIETFSYNDHEQLVRHLDAEENVTLYEYYPVSDPAGGHSSDSGEGGYLRRVTRDAESGAGRNGGTDPAPVEQVTEYEYTEQLEGAFPASPRGVPTAITNPRGVKTLFKVNEADQVVEIIRAAEIVPGSESGLVDYQYRETREYDSNGNVIETSVEDRDALDGDDDPIVTTFEFDILNQLTRKVEDVGGLAIETRWYRDPSQNLIKRIRAVGTDEEQVEEWTWDERDLPVSHVRGVGTDDESTTTFEVDDNGNITKVIDAAGEDETELSYDGFDRLVEVVNREGERTTFLHDAASNVIQTEWFGPGDETRTGEEHLAGTEVALDERGRVYRTSRQLFHIPGRDVGELHDEDGEDDDLLTTLVTRDRLGRVVEVVDPDLDLTEQRWDGLSRLLEVEDPLHDILRRTYDAAGNVRSATSVELASETGLLTTPEEFEWTYDFDSLDRLTKTTEPNGQETILQYDSRGNVIKTTDELENEVEYRHDRLSRLVESRRYLSSDGTGAHDGTEDTDQGGGDGIITLSQEWDACGRITHRTDDTGNDTRYGYDDLDRLRGIDYPDGTNESWTYNDDSEMTTHSLRDCSVESWTHDAESRPTHLEITTSLRGTVDRRWGRDGLGRVTWSLDDNGSLQDVEQEFFYDSLSRVIRETQLVGGFDPMDVDTEWSGLDRPVLLTHPAGRILERTFDALDRIEEIREGASGPAIVHYARVGPSRLLKMDLASGLVLDKRDPVTGSTIDGDDAGYDVNGRSVRDAWQDDEEDPLVTWLYGYNGPAGVGTNRIVEQSRTLWEEDPEIDVATLDSAYRQLTFDRNGVGSARELDGANKMTAFLDEGVDRDPVVDGDPLEAGMNQYSEMDSEERYYTAAGTFDTDGNLVFFHDASERLVAVEDKEENVLAEFAYSADGRRVLQWKHETPTRYIWSGWQVIEEQGEHGDPTFQYVTGRSLDDHVQIFDVVGEATWYPLSSATGSVGVLTDDGGRIAESYTYSWLGRPLVVDWDDPLNPLDHSPRGNPHLWQGSRWDAETGLYHFRRRDFSPTVGEFITLDPLGTWQHGMGNGYEAFAGDAWNNRDPMGEMPTIVMPTPAEVDAAIASIERATAAAAARAAASAASASAAGSTAAASSLWPAGLAYAAVEGLSWYSQATDEADTAQLAFNPLEPPERTSFSENSAPPRTPREWEAFKTQYPGDWEQLADLWWAGGASSRVDLVCSVPTDETTGGAHQPRRPTAATRRKADEAARAADGTVYCQYCGIEVLDESGSQESKEYDHEMPHSRGGSRDPANIVVACRTCNRKKGNKTPEEWRTASEEKPK